MPHETLISAPGLNAHLDDPGWVVFDCRFVLSPTGGGDAGEALYREGHIPGARFAHMERNLSSPAAPEKGRHPLPPGEAFSAWLAAQGVNRGSQVVAYDEGPGMAASRLWFLLKAMGHAAVAVLDGGLGGWQREGLPLTAEPPALTPGDFRGAFDPRATIDLPELLPIHTDPALALVDARGARRFEGLEEPLDRVAGHIPTALNRFSGENTGGDGRFLPPDRLRARYAAAAEGRTPEQVIHYCGSGVAACHNLLAMAVAGFPLGRVYIGSWSQWSADPARPVATGKEA